MILRPLIESDCEGPYPTWFNDSEVCMGNSHHVFPYAIQQAVSYVKDTAIKSAGLVLAIVDADKKTHIGNISLDPINYIYRTSEFSIVIGDKSYWGKGFGKESARLLFSHGFFAMNLDRIACGTLGSNTAMIKLAKYMGMKEEGKRRKAAYKNGNYIDIIEFGILREEYERRFARPE